MFGDLRHDWARHVDGGSWRVVFRALITQGLWATAEYRFGHWARTGAPAWSRPAFMAVSIVTHLTIQAVTGISISPSARIGPGLQVGHPGTIVVHPGVVIGPECTLGHEVTIGQDVSPPFGVPIVGRGVFFAPGAKVFGDIEIGDHVAIGANAVVRESLPDRAIAVGVPARIVRIQDPGEVSVAEVAR